MAITGCLDAATDEAPVFIVLHNWSDLEQQLLAVSRLACWMHGAMQYRVHAHAHHEDSTRGLNLTENSEAHGTRSRSKACGL